MKVSYRQSNDPGFGLVVWCVGRSEGLSLLLCLELQAKANLVAPGVDVLPVQESREGQLDACSTEENNLRGDPTWATSLRDGRQIIYYNGLINVSV